MFIDRMIMEAPNKGAPADEVILPASVVGSWADKLGAANMHPTVKMKSRRNWKFIQPPRTKDGKREGVEEAWGDAAFRPEPK